VYPFSIGMLYQITSGSDNVDVLELPAVLAGEAIKPITPTVTRIYKEFAELDG